jgi:uncharacterized protein YcbK (DUF882 family)
LLFSRDVTLTPVVILIGMRISAAASLGPAADALAPSTGLAASLAIQSVADAPLPQISLEELTGVETTFFNVNTRETETFFLRYDGVMSKLDEQRITHLFRCKRSGHERKPDRGLLQILARLADRYRGHVFEVVSAHRFNRGTSRTSKHRSGHALDLRIRGVGVKEVRSFVWKMDAPIGLGYYREQQFLHIDHRPVEGKIAWDQRTETSAYHYHPAWSGGPKHAKKSKAKKAAKPRPSRRLSLRSSQPQS